LGALCAALVGCGGGAPLLHGAHVLAPGDTAQGAGFSGTFALGDAKLAARSQRPAEQSAAIDALAPSVAPWVNARVGIDGDNEAGLTYTGRTARLDARHAFVDEKVALSVGAGASAVLRGREEQRDSVAGSARAPWGFGFDVPIVVGWRSTAGVVTVWAGARGGFETLHADASSAIALEMQRMYAGGLVGLSVGFRHVHGSLELDASYQRVSGSFAGDDVKLSAFTLAPGAGLILNF
jgi:hypothetical protein